MTVTKTYCDRCGQEFDRTNFSPLIVGEFINTNGGVKIFDLCPTCQEELDKWYGVKNDNIVDGEFREVE